MFGWGDEMIYDILEIFKKEYEQKGDKLILDNYILKDGLYVKVNKDESVEYYITKTVKKEKIFQTLDGLQANNIFDWFKERDYYSGYLNSNKAFDDKKIHNINYLSFFVKVESFNEQGDKQLDKNAIRNQYLSLLNYKKFKKKEEAEILKNYQSFLNTCKRKKDLAKKYRFIENNILTIVNTAKENQVDNYCKNAFEMLVFCS